MNISGRDFFKKYWFIILVLVLELIMIVAFAFSSRADINAQSSYSLYDNLTVNSSALSNYLVPYYRSQFFYSPFNSWCAFRSGQYSYVMIVKCSDSEYYHIFYNPSQNGTYSLTYDSSSSAPVINYLGFVGVGSGDDSFYDHSKMLELSSDREYSQNYVIYVLVLFCSMLFVFSIFRNRVNPFSERRLK